MTQSPSPTARLAMELIRCESVTPHDAGCQGIIEARLRTAGFATERLDSGPVANLWATRGREGPVLVFAGHTDVVPPGPASAWTTGPFVPQIENGMLTGRGAADMKGSLAAMVTAVERFVASQPMHDGTIGFLLTSDEEGDAIDGTRRAMECLTRRGIQFTWCIVGEPSCTERLGDTLRVGRRGSLNGRLLVKGQQGHVAYPDNAVNPIHRCLGALEELVETTWDNGNEHFPATSLQLTNVRAGDGTVNVVPGQMDVLFNFRFSPESSSQGLMARTRSILDRHDLDYALDWQLSGEPFSAGGDHLVETMAASIRQVTGLEPTLSTGGGTSDGRFIAPTGAEVVEFGPVNATIHQVNERVALADLDALSLVYEATLNRLCAAAGNSATPS